MRFVVLLLISLCWLSCRNTVEKSQSTIVIENSPPLKDDSGLLGTQSYAPTLKEAAFLKKLTDGGYDSDVSGENGYKLAGRNGEYVGWFGIVREIVMVEDKTRLLVEMKYFDNLTDLHIHIVSIYGVGDFWAEMAGDVSGIPRLSLVKVYGTVLEDADGIPVVGSDYIRVWKWGHFTFMDYGKDNSNPKWVALRKTKYEMIYDPRPDRKYYEDRIGDFETGDSFSKKNAQIAKSEWLDNYIEAHYFSDPFIINETIKPVIASLKKRDFKKALRKLDKIEIGEPPDMNPIIWKDFRLLYAYAYLAVGEKEKAVESLLKVLELPRILAEDVCYVWGFLGDLGYSIPPDQKDRVLGLVMETASDAAGKNFLKLILFYDGDVTLESRTGTGGSSASDNRKHVESVKGMILSAQKEIRLFAGRETDYYAFMKDLKLSSLFEKPALALGITRFTAIVPFGIRIHETQTSSLINGQHPLAKLYMTAQPIIKKLD